MMVLKASRLFMQTRKEPDQSRQCNHPRDVTTIVKGEQYREKRFEYTEAFNRLKTRAYEQNA